MQLKSLLVSVAVLVLALAHGAAVSAESSSSPKLKVGLILPLTGSAAEYGNAIMNAIALAKEDLPALNERVDFIAEDVAYDTGRAVSAFQKLVDVDRVDLVFTFGVNFCQALAPIAENRKRVLIGECVDESASAGRSYMIRFLNNSHDYMRLLAQYLSQQNLNDLSFVITENGYLERMFDSFETVTGRKFSDVQRVPMSEMNFRSNIARIKSRKPDAVGVFLFPGQLAQFFKQAKELSLNVSAFGTNTMESQSEVHNAGGAMEGVLFVNNIVRDDFAARYFARYSSSSHLAFAGPAYEFALMLAKLDSAMVKQSPEQALEALKKLEPQPGAATGAFSLKHSATAGYFADFPLGVKKITGDGFKVVNETLDPAVDAAALSAK